ncbi:HNH endonuclease [Planctomycetota bacterium]|nr:HNH endonuclease [Planctomycetota bacterium]
MKVDDLSTFGVALLQLLDEAATNSSYKYALLLALTDAATESIGQRGGPRGSVTTEELARRVIDLYWPQSYPWPHAEGGAAVLAALESKGRSIVDLIVSAREALGPRASAREVERRAPAAWKALLDRVEEILIRYPIPLLQRVGSQRVNLLFNPEAWPLKGKGLPLGAYFRSRRAEGGGFDNRVLFNPGAELHLAQLGPLLRPLIMERWARFTARANALTGERSLEDFLFGSDRVSLDQVRTPLRDLQQGRCFYCGTPLARQCHVDHFIPLARSGCNDLFNLVAAHGKCNLQKSDHLAAAPHIERWARRLEDHAGDLHRIADDLHWAADGPRARRVAHSTYKLAGGLTQLWVEESTFVPLAPTALAPLA